jgi:ubiquinone biosynthesis protein UbiJ
MALLSREVYDALREIGVSDAQALKTAEALAIPNKDIAEIRTDVAVIKVTVEQLQHRLTLMMTVMFLVLGGVLSTLWVLARH